MNTLAKAPLPSRLALPLSMLVLGVVAGAWAFGSNGDRSARGVAEVTERPHGGVLRPTARTGVEDEGPRWRDLDVRLQQEILARQRLAEEVAALHERVQALSVQLAGAERPAASADSSHVPSIEDSALTEASLVAAGLSEEQAGEIVRRQADWEMQRLELRDEAQRGGWLFTQRYYDAVAGLEGGIEDMRATLGDELYDRYLYASGQSNRIMVTSVIDGSPAAQAGLEPGDVIVSYAGARLFAGAALRTATSEGSRGEYVTVRVQREGRDLDLLVPRGPLGVRLQMARLDPNAERDGTVP